MRYMWVVLGRVSVPVCNVFSLYKFAFQRGINSFAITHCMILGMKKNGERKRNLG